MWDSLSPSEKEVWIRENAPLPAADAGEGETVVVAESKSPAAPDAGAKNAPVVADTAGTPPPPPPPRSFPARGAPLPAPTPEGLEAEKAAEQQIVVQLRKAEEALGEAEKAVTAGSSEKTALTALTALTASKEERGMWRYVKHVLRNNRCYGMRNEKVIENTIKNRICLWNTTTNHVAKHQWINGQTPRIPL